MLVKLVKLHTTLIGIQLVIIKKKVRVKQVLKLLRSVVQLLSHGDGFISCWADPPFPTDELRV